MGCPTSRARLLMTVLTALALVPRPAAASDVRERLGAYIAANQQAILRELTELLAIPNVPAENEDARLNAERLRRMLSRRGLRTEILQTGNNPVVYGELRVPGVSRTLLVYGHYDGLPVEPRLWQQPDPFTPVLRDGPLDQGGREVRAFLNLDKFDPEWRLYARSAADAKGPIVALCAALDAMKASGLTPTSNLRVILDGEEESGSPSLAAIVERERDKLQADVLLMLEDPTHPSGRPTVVFGARGYLGIDLTVYGPRSGAHSGHYGNWVPNPGIRLARLLASMKDDDGRVLIEGFYDGVEPLSPEEQAMLDAVPDDPEALKRVFAIAEPERPGLSLQQALQLPTLNVRGLTSAYTGPDARTIIPDQATAALDIRLVKGTPAADLADKVRAHLLTQGYHLVESDPVDAVRLQHPRIVKVVTRGSTPAYRTSPTIAESQLLTSALERMFGEPPVRIRTSGATVPIASQLIEAFGFPAYTLPTTNVDSNQHGENENLRLGHLFTGIVSIAAVLTM